MTLIEVVRRTWWLFATDAAIYAVNVLMFSPEDKQTAVVNLLFEIGSYAIVTIAGFFAARHTGRILDAIKIGALFWFIWKPALFLISSGLSLAGGSVDYERVKMAALGYLLALLLFSPIAIALCGGGGWVGKNSRQSGAS